jgi:hypothetical protein
VIRFSAFLVTVAVGLLVAGVVTSRLLLVYTAIGVSAAALLALGAGAVMRRGELFGEPATAAPAGAAGAAAQPAGLTAAQPSPASPPGQDARRLPEPAVSALGWQGPLSWPPRAAPAPQAGAPGVRPTPEAPGPAAAPEPPWPPAAAAAVPAADQTSVDLPPVPAADQTSVDLPPVPAADQTSVDLPPVPAADQTSVDLPPVPAAGQASADPTPESGGQGADSPAARQAATTEAAAAPGAPGRAAADEQREVTVVPGVPRYHDAHCILIRFMAEDALEKTTLAAAREAGCTPCRACQPGQPEAPGQAEAPGQPEAPGQAEVPGQAAAAGPDTTAGTAGTTGTRQAPPG